MKSSARKTKQNQAAAPAIVMQPVLQLVPYARNPRKNDDVVDRMVASIREFGFKVPVLARSNGDVVDGHLRLKAAHQLGITEVPVILCDEWTEAQVKAFRLLVNKSVEWADWDEELLALEFQDLKDLDFDLDLTGFDLDEINELLEPEPEKEHHTRPPIIKTATLEDLAPTEEEQAIFAGRKILVEFSGGIDSSASSIWAKHFFPESEIELCFVDMGADHPGFNLFVHDFAAALGVELNVLRSEENIIEAFLQKGAWPGHFHPYCHEILHQALDDNIKTYPPDRVITVRSGRLKEKAGAGKENPDRFLVIDRLKKYRYFQPLYFTDKDVGESILEEAGLPVWEGYSYGLQRTACRICPGQRPVAYAAIRRNFPQTWAELIELERRFGPGLWQDSSGMGHDSLVDSADRGEKAFSEGDYRLRG